MNLLSALEKAEERFTTFFLHSALNLLGFVFMM